MRPRAFRAIYPHRVKTGMRARESGHCLNSQGYESMAATTPICTAGLAAAIARYAR
jgi:hypothetical protein